MIKNIILELYNNETKLILYAALETNKNIMYTRNERSTPIRTKTGIDNVYMIENNNKTYTIVVEPDKQQLDYFDYKILNIDESIKKDFTILELKDYKAQFINAMESSQFTFLSQYNSESVYQYILSS
jgi:hypothetical protein